jgi:hypothetical protein
LGPDGRIWFTDYDDHAVYKIGLEAEEEEVQDTASTDTPSVSIQTILNQQLVVYPNPSSGQFTLYSESPMDISIYNLEGRQVAALRHEGTGKLAIDAQAWTKGIYFLTAISAQGKITKRLVRQ